MDNPKVSIIMAAYNAELYIEQTICSILKQNYINWELFIVDDCSTDSTLKIIEDFAINDSRINILRCSKNSGQAHARNIGIKNATGKYITFIDSDDIWKDKFLERMINFMENNGYDVAFSGFERMNEDLKKSYGVLSVPNSITYYHLLKNNYMSCLTTIYNKESLGKIYFEEDYKHEDHILWINILKNYVDRAYGFNESLAIYRIRSNSVSRNKIRSAKWKWLIYRKYLKFNLLLSSYYFIIYCINGMIKNKKFISFR